MMISKTLLLLRRVASNLTARVLFGAVLAFAMAFLSPLFEPLLPDEWEIKIGPDAVIPILNILATTMLTVTTFSLSVMVQAYQAAASQATPRAYRLHLSDTTTQAPGRCVTSIRLVKRARGNISVGLGRYSR